MAFIGEVDGGPGSEGVFIWKEGALEAFALAGQKSPRGQTYQRFSRVSIIGSLVEFHYSLAIQAEMVEGQKAVLLLRSPDRISQPLTTGDKTLLKGERVEDFIISRLGWSMAAVVQVRRRREGRTERYRKVIIVDDFLIVGNAVKEGAKYPVFGKIKRILEPPAMHFQQGYAAV